MDLFGGMQGGERLGLPDAEVTFWRYVDLCPSGKLLLDSLIEETAWEHREVFVWGQKRKQPRLTAWYGDKGKSYRYSGASFEPLPWSDLLFSLKRQVEGIVKSDFNSVLLNLYRDNQDSMGLHSDDEPELGMTPTIASVSIGAERVMTFKHKRNAAAKTLRISLPSQSLIVMSGKTQSYWKHGISKQLASCGARVNLTFRRIY